MLKSSAHWLEFPVMPEQKHDDEKHEGDVLKSVFYNSRHGKYLIKQVDCDVIEKGHISPSVPLSVHWLLG